MENNKEQNVPEAAKPAESKPAETPIASSLPISQVSPIEEKPVVVDPLVSFDDFKKIDLRVGKVLSVEVHPKADKLYIVKVDIGTEVRQVVAGLRPFMGPEGLLNKNVVVIVNLKPAVLRGAESNGMILAASADTPTGREVVILTTDKDLPPGSKIS